MVVNNRMVMSSMSSGVSLDSSGYPTDRMIAYYEERARSRPGMMGVGAGAVVVPEQTQKGVKSAVALYTDKCIAPVSALVDAVHQYDTRFGIQLWDGGLQAGSEVLLTPSGIGVNATAVVNQGNESRLKVLSLDDIAAVISQFADGAERCMTAGFDFVEIHAGHGYLISSFLTPFFNRRDDHYGGSFENRSRFLLDILRAVKARVGHRMAVGVKINGEDYLPDGGWTLTDTCALAPLLEDAGADYLAVTAGIMGSPRLTVPPMYEPQGCFAELAFEVKNRVAIPVSTVGRIKDPLMAAQFVHEHKVDLVAMGRPMIADPDIVDKTRRGALEEIRPCLADCRGCLDQQMRTIKRGEPTSTSCIVNPRVGRERDCVDIRDSKRSASKTVMVVGAGCAGLEAARIAAFNGHQVTLFEARPVIGGQIRMAERMPGRHEIGDILPWYETQLAKLGVKIRLNSSVDQTLLAQFSPDELIVATGSLPGVPQHLMGFIEQTQAVAVVTLDDLLEGGIDPGKHVVVYGGDQMGLQVADYLSERGCAVVVAEEGRHFAAKMAANDRWYLTGRILQKGVKRLKNVTALEVASGDKVRVTSGGVQSDLGAVETLVLASERVSERSLADVARRLGISTHVIGEAADVTSEDACTIFASIAQGYDVGRSL